MSRAGTKIRLARVKKGLTLEQLAKKVGISAPYISDIERGNRRGKYATIKRIADELGLDADALWGAA